MFFTSLFFTFGVFSSLQFDSKNGVAFFFSFFETTTIHNKEKSKVHQTVLDKKPWKNVPSLCFNCLFLWKEKGVEILVFKQLD